MKWDAEAADVLQRQLDALFPDGCTVTIAIPDEPFEDPDAVSFATPRLVVGEDGMGGIQIRAIPLDGVKDVLFDVDTMSDYYGSGVMADSFVDKQVLTSDGRHIRLTNALTPETRALLAKARSESPEFYS